MSAEKKTKGVEAVDKALHILSLFDLNNTALTLTEISERSGFVKSTTLRMLVSLQQSRLVTLVDKRYRIGAEALRLGNLYQRDFRLASAIRPVLHELVERTGESASFFRREGNMRVCLFREDSLQILREHVAEGEAVALDRGAAGHVLMTFDNVEGQMPANAAVLAQLPRASTGERGAGITGIAVPIFAAGQGLLGALTVSGPSTRFTTEKSADYSDLLMAVAARVSTELGSRFYG